MLTFFRLKKEPGHRPPTYYHILNQPPIRDVLDSPSMDERNFVCSMIEKISQTDNSD
jgi:hypothetical protein